MERDVSVIDLTVDEKLVIACDSIGRIGPKEEDIVETSGRIVGKLSARVALMEALAVRATPISVVNTLSVEYEPTGKEIIAGIEEEIAVLDMVEGDIITGSTEENIPTLQTGIGITVVGRAAKEELRVADSQSGDLMVALGLPKVGDEVLESIEEIVNLADLEQILELDYIHDILPVGSKGIKYEAELLAELNGLGLELEETVIDLKKSAGPATALLLTLPEEYWAELKNLFSKPLNLLGRLHSP
ncbi:AIR synthase related protein [Acetohalobium arabaticum]|uniref:PurM-like N-terminal domain-containing protein n=1 Tax=Acetohalobium arabaticum (strain ATCC 49924 / DSM 5501 / Z-7288) TaxID=574087 RepID=D9QVP2_ACEAZ|nr:AIR synthase related protein [Acetohalobium arabaticum]ADL12301.1 conserved hypothetical protein [Acetohalobium arabaticum DSM 5501]